ncbi:unnamed protein product [Cylicostephanus goldi]|uniref:Uncharacterized protein n=1 Tax=Cylicostephanus goldi TaxID=71465 RepID=A0A3P6T0D3_CYLGO|nr:unnamed protein product [Cylicostephanus goldi]
MEEYAESASKAEEGDSGLSGVEGQADTGRRDACCSPVRHFPSSARISVRNKPSSRRHTPAGGSSQPSSSRKQHCRSGSAVSCSAASGSCLRSASSGSEGDGADNLFVPARRQRTSSIEYDGEPEQSDADILA